MWLLASTSRRHDVKRWWLITRLANLLGSYQGTLFQLFQCPIVAMNLVELTLSPNLRAFVLDLQSSTCSEIQISCAWVIWCDQQSSIAKKSHMQGLWNLSNFDLLRFSQNRFLQLILKMPKVFGVGNQQLSWGKCASWLPSSLENELSSLFPWCKQLSWICHLKLQVASGPTSFAA